MLICNGLYLKSCDQRECEDWVETCKIILTGLHDDPDVHSGIPDGKDPADGLETEVRIPHKLTPSGIFFRSKTTTSYTDTS